MSRQPESVGGENERRDGVAKIFGLFAFLPLLRKTLVSPKARPQKPPRTLGERLRAWRLARGFEQRDAAALLGVRPATYGRWERDQRRPSVRLMPRVLTILGPGPFES